MNCNVGRTEATVRMFLGALMIGLGVIFQSWWGAIGVIPIATAFIKWCPLSALFGISTCEESAGKA